jgi:hypothetical protein
MNRHRAVVLLALATAPVVAIAASCSFPDPTFFPGDGSTSTGDGPNGGDGGPDGSDALPPIGANEDVEEGGLTADATLAPDAQRVDAAVGCCDCDTDNFKADGGACAAPAGDCDDYNPYLFPGKDREFEKSVQWQSDHQPTYDWNCDGVTTKQYPYNVSCDGLLNGGCMREGFKGNVSACGASGTYIKCKTGIPGVSCVQDGLDETRTQGCR